MDPLNITQNDDGTLTLEGTPADPVSVTDELWVELAQNEHVVVDARPAGDQGQPAVTYLQLTCTNYWLSYTVIRHAGGRYQLELGGYSEL